MASFSLMIGMTFMLISWFIVAHRCSIVDRDRKSLLVTSTCLGR